MPGLSYSSYIRPGFAPRYGGGSEFTTFTPATTSLTVSATGASITKTSGTAAWSESSAYGGPFTGDFRVDYTVTDVTKALAAVLVANPSANASYTDGDAYGISHATSAITELNAGVITATALGATANGDIFSIGRIGSEMVRWHNGQEVATRATISTGPIYAKFAFYDVGAGVVDVAQQAIVYSATLVLTNSAGGSFFNIPQTGRSIIITGELRSARAAVSETGVFIRINGRRANYGAEYQASDGTVSSSVAGTNTAGITGMQFGVPAATAPASESAAIRVLLPRYAATTFNKKALLRKGQRRGTLAADYQVQNAIFFNLATTGITQIEFLSENKDRLTGELNLLVI